VTLIARSDPSLFTAFALLNACGYNSENGWQYSATRKAVRLRLADRSAHWRSALKADGLLEIIVRAGGAMLMDIIPLVSGPPDFIFQNEAHYTASWQRDSRFSLAGLEHWLKRFYVDEALSMLWSDHLVVYKKAEATLERSSHRLEDIASEFGEPSLEIVLLPNLLDVRGRGYSVSLEGSSWLFFGPIDDECDAESLSVHELVHRWIDVAAERAVSETGAADPMPQARAQFRMVAESYPDFAIWISETAVRAVTAWLMHERSDSRLQRLKDDIAFCEEIGFIGIQEAYNLLSSGRKRSLPELVREAIHVIRDKTLSVCTQVDSGT
jgi:hypothetical protein